MVPSHPNCLLSYDSIVLYHLHRVWHNWEAHSPPLGPNQPLVLAAFPHFPDKAISSKKLKGLPVLADPMEIIQHYMYALRTFLVEAGVPGAEPLL